MTQIDQPEQAAGLCFSLPAEPFAERVRRRFAGTAVDTLPVPGRQLPAFHRSGAPGFAKAWGGNPRPAAGGIPAPLLVIPAKAGIQRRG